MDSRQKMQRFQPISERPSAARDLLRALVDEGSFVEQEAHVCSPRGSMFRRDGVPGDGLVGGFGQIDERLVCLAAQDTAVFKGAVGLVHAQKFARLCEQAQAALTPFIALLDSGGVRAEEGLAALEGLALMQRAFARAKGDIPLIVVLVGPVTGALGFLAEQADLVIVCEDRGGLYFHGPGVTSARAESGAAPNALGGAAVLARRIGLVGLSVPDTAALPKLLRQVFRYDFSSASLETNADDDPNRAEEALDAWAADSDGDWDVEKIAGLVFDRGLLLPCYEAYAPELYCALAFLGGVPVALTAQRGPGLGLAAGDKLARFTALSACFSLPLISFTQGEGFIQSEEAEREGLTLSAAKLCRAFSEYPHTRLNVYLGAAYGSHLLTFNSKWLGCERAFAWPTAELGLLPAESLLALFGEKDLQAVAGLEPDARAALVDEYEDRLVSPAQATAAGLVDEVILPSLTRPYLYAALQAVRQTY